MSGEAAKGKEGEQQHHHRRSSLMSSGIIKAGELEIKGVLGEASLPHPTAHTESASQADGNLKLVTLPCEPRSLEI